MRGRFAKTGATYDLALRTLQNSLDTMPLMPGCETQEKLRRDALGILERIDALHRGQIEAMANADDERLMTLDKELENVFGEKERAFGALRQHRDEHRC